MSFVGAVSMREAAGLGMGVPSPEFGGVPDSCEPEWAVRWPRSQHRGGTARGELLPLPPTDEARPEATEATATGLLALVTTAGVAFFAGSVLALHVLHPANAGAISNYSAGPTVAS